MKIIFFGSDDFASAHLEHLLREKFQVVACVTQPDKPRDRMKVTFSPIKEIALREKMDCLQPDTLKDSRIVEDLKAYQADVFVVIAYGKILPQSVLDIPKVCAVNVHGSILPQYRGAAPINWAVINGETETGLTIIRMSADLDAGDILRIEKLSIGEDESAESVRRRMMDVGPGVLADVLRELSSGRLTTGARQNPEQATYAPKLTREMGKIDWSRSSQEIHNLVRGLMPQPKAHAFYQGKVLKILRARMVPASGRPGEVMDVNKEGITVACGRGALLILEVHPESGKPMDAASFARGQHLKPGDRFDGSPVE